MLEGVLMESASAIQAGGWRYGIDGGGGLGFAWVTIRAIVRASSVYSVALINEYRHIAYERHVCGCDRLNQKCSSVELSLRRTHATSSGTESCSLR